MKTTLRLVALGLFALAHMGFLCAADFSAVKAPWTVSRGGSTNETVRSKQAWTDSEGLHVSLDQTQAVMPNWNWGSVWTTGRVGEFADGDTIVLRAKYFPGTLLDADANVSLSDAKGRGNVAAPRQKIELVDGERRFTFRIDSKIGRKPGEVREGPFALTCISFGFQRPKGEAIFTSVEKVEVAAEVKRSLTATFPIDVDRTHPGADPFERADEIRVVLQERVEGEVELRLKRLEGPYYGKDVPPIKAMAKNGVAVFKTDLVPGWLYEFWEVRQRGRWLAPESANGYVAANAAEALSLEIDTGNRLHLVRTNLDERAVAVFRNLSGTALDWTGELVAWDDSDRAPVRQSLTLSIPAYGERRIGLPNPMPRMGLWRVRYEATGADGSRATHESRFAQIAHHRVEKKLPFGKFRFGPNYHMASFGPNDRDLTTTLDAMTAMGATFVRAGICMDFASVCRTNATPNWRAPDKFLDLLERRGVGVDSIIYTAPAWARLEDRGGTTHDQRYVPCRSGLFRDFCRQLAERYGARMDYYEIGNEWDLLRTNRLTIAEACAAQREGYEGLKSGNPNARVITCGWTVSSSEHPMVKQKGMQEEVLKTGCFDVHPVHLHCPFYRYKEYLDDFFAMRKRLGVTKPWFANETALTSAYDETAVADCVWQKIVYSWAKGSTDYVWYNLIANGCNPKDSEGGYGLMSHDFHPRYGYAAFAALAATLKGFDFVREIAGKDVPPLYVFRGERGGEHQVVLVSWNDLTDKEFDVRFSSDAKSVDTVDLYGNHERCSGSLWRVPVRPSALLLKGATQVEANVVGFSAKREVAVLKVGSGDFKIREPDMRIGDKLQVFDIYQANPGEIHRMWQGPNDLSAKVWWEKTSVGVRARVVVVDDHFTGGDQVKLQYAEGDGSTHEIVVGDFRREGTQAEAIVEISCKTDNLLVNVELREDDGEGLDATLTYSPHPVRLEFDCHE